MFCAMLCRLEDGVKLYRKALTADPQCMLAAEGLATLLTDEGTKLKLAGQPDMGFAKYKEAAQLFPAYAPAHYNMGIMYAERGQTDEALKASAVRILFLNCAEIPSI